MEKRPAISQGTKQTSPKGPKWIQNSADKPSMTSRPASTGPKPKN